uniref:Uncharacterized protein n=1 Tax=Molossus molossus TaxID=27622 RepID=A0A7J8BYL7_MOLMO|nr:hypothetical protein HJG59_010090 [Molossus molossus]
MGTGRPSPRPLLRVRRFHGYRRASAPVDAARQAPHLQRAGLGGRGAGRERASLMDRRGGVRPAHVLVSIVKDTPNSFKNYALMKSGRTQLPAPSAPGGVQEMPLWCVDVLELKALAKQRLSLNSPHLPNARGREGTQLSHPPSPGTTDL